ALGGALNRWTGLNPWLMGQLTARFGSAARPKSLEHVRIIALRDDTDLTSIAAQQRLAGVDASARTSWRALHGRLMQKLADAGARVVAWDIGFDQPSEQFDPVFAAGADALRNAGCAVVVGAGGD